MTQVWKCIYTNCNMVINEEEELQFFEDVVRMHIAMHVPAGSDKPRPKDGADWTAMEKLPADTYLVGQMSTANLTTANLTTSKS